jgi:uncharacterized protein
MATWREAIRLYIEQEAKPVEKFGHQPRLYALAGEIGAGLQYDDDVVYAAAWLHDLGVFHGHRPEEPDALARWDNVKYAISKTPLILENAGFPRPKIPAVLEAIRTHQPSGEPVAIESVILRDADILEQLGAIGILRAVCKIGRDTRYSTLTDGVQVLRTALEELPSQIRLKSARALAQSRVELLNAFLAAVDRDSFGALF